MKGSKLALLSASLLCLSMCTFSAVRGEEVGASESQGINLTIYNQNFGVVKDKRVIELHDGINEVRFSDVASQIDPTSVSLQSLTAPNSLVVREQNYQYDLISPETILDKSIGKTLKFRQVLENGTVREFSGTLISGPGQGRVIKTADGIILNPGGEIEVAELPAGLISKPSLLWKLETNKPGAHTTEVAYQTNGISWKADYVAVLNAADDRLNLNSWVTLDNKSGATYPNAALKLLAGDVHRVQESPVYPNRGVMLEACDGVAPQFKEASFAEYHLYTLQGKTTVRDNETKQMSLFNADNIPAKKLFVYEPNASHIYWGNQNGQQKVAIKIEVENSQKNNLGMAMPKGKVRVYKHDADGALQFIGEDEIDHTPKDEKVRLYIGDAFDLVGEHRMMRQENITPHLQRQSYEVSLRNHRAGDATITVIEHPYGDWTLMNSTVPGVRKDNHTLEFPVNVKANSEVKITYQIENKY